MKLLVLLICLLALRFFHIPRPLLTRWFGAYIHAWVHFLSKQAWFGSAGGVILIALVPSLIIHLMTPLYFVPLILDCLVVLFCLCVTYELPPTFIHAHVPAFTIDIRSIPSTLWQNNYFYVTPLFWYLIAGPAGIIFYTCFLYASFCTAMPQWQALSAKIVEIAAWLPCRITGLAYGLAGQLKPTLKVWSELVMTDHQTNHVFLLHCAAAAYPAQTETTPTATYQKLLSDAEILLLGLFAALAVLSLLF